MRVRSLVASAASPKSPPRARAVSVGNLATIENNPAWFALSAHSKSPSVSSPKAPISCSHGALATTAVLSKAGKTAAEGAAGRVARDAAAAADEEKELPPPATASAAAAAVAALPRLMALYVLSTALQNFMFTEHPFPPPRRVTHDPLLSVPSVTGSKNCRTA